MSDFDFELLNELVNDAPVAGYGPQVNFGKCTLEVNINSWNNDTHKFEVRSFAKGEQLKNGEYLQITFHVDVTELNPVLTNEYKRRVDVKKSGPKSKTDWSETVEPSLMKVFGKDWTKKLGKGVYVCIEDAETVETNKQGELKGWDKDGKHYTNNAPKFIAVYKSKAECETARAERFSKKDANGSSEPESNIPAKVISDVQGLIKSVGLEQAETLLASKPFGDYEPSELIAAANPL